MPDPLALTMNQDVVKQGPALSATSDMPVPIEAAPVETTETTEAKETPPEEKAAETTADEAKEEGKDTTPPWMKREITIERNKRREAEQRANEAAAQLNQALRALESASVRNATKSDDTRPAREAFDDPTEYDDALIAWSSRRASAVTLAETEARRAQESIQRQQETIQAEWKGRLEKALVDMPDYAEVAERDDLSISMPMAQAIITAPNGPQIAYHLGKNPEEAARIASLPPPQAVFEMGLLAASLKPPKPGVSQAPKPPKPIGSRADASPKGPDEESMEEYAARRKKELRGRSP